MLKRLSVTVLAMSGVGFSGGYKIPEQSLNSMALGAAYIAHTEGADTAYFNPAALVFQPEGRLVEGGVTLAHLPPNQYTLIAPYSGKSKTENIPIPFLHYVGASQDTWRWGVSVTAPAGLTKRWDSPYQKAFAQEFTLQNVEVNPVASYKVSETFAIGGGIRMVYSQGKVYSDGYDAGIPLKREMEGNTFAFGYNAALYWKPSREWEVALTYRSKIDLNEEGKANLYFGGVGRQYDASVSIPIPAALNLAVAKTFQERFTLEFVYERTYWSAYRTLDFEYAQPILNPTLKEAFDDPLTREWRDSDSFRIGATVKMDNKLTAMFGFAIDETPVNERYLGFELPDSDAKIFSMGFSYAQSDHVSWGVALLYDAKEARSLQKGVVSENLVLQNGGTFSGGGATLLSVGVRYRY